MNGLIGFVLGFVFGMAVNAYLLRGIPRDEMRRNKDLRMKYGLLNWGLALLGLVIGLAL